MIAVPDAVSATIVDVSPQDSADGAHHADPTDAAGDSRRSERIVLDLAEPDRSALRRAAEILRSGGLVAFPTETVYGLGAHALDLRATSALFAAKGRPSTDPLIVHVADPVQAEELTTRWDDRARRLAARFWPGPLTLVMSKNPKVPDEITAGRPTVAVRIPNHRVALGLLGEAAIPVAAPSANRFGRISPTNADAVESELLGRYDMLLDAGPTVIGVESTVLDLSGTMPVVLRPGGVGVEDIQALIGEVRLLERRTQSESTDAPAPGQFLRHYSPSTPLIAVEGTRELAHHIRDSLRERGVDAELLEIPDEPTDVARTLYATLRSADGKADLLLIRTVGTEGLGLAVNDRIFRASQGHLLTGCDDDSLEVAERLAAPGRSAQGGT